MFEALELSSGASRRALLEGEMMTTRKEIERKYCCLQEFEDKLLDKADTLQHALSRVRDIWGTLSRLQQGATLDDVALFEIKELCLISEEVRAILECKGVTCLALPQLTEPLELLDIEGQCVPSFYVYDGYSAELARLRDNLRRNEGDRNELLLSIADEEYRVRGELTAELQPFAGALTDALATLLEVDITLAKALQKRALGLAIPAFSITRQTKYIGLFHPPTKEQLSVRGKEFQPIDFEFGARPTTIIGANMGGKTLILKMSALAQYLFQFGFAVPAEIAEIDIKETIYLFVGGKEMTGLSSFASEVVGINEIIERARAGDRMLALLDEPAHTTNPIEGAALVSALVETLKDTNTDFVVTTHYNLTENVSRKLKVRGLTDGKMDYRLEETTSAEVPREAIATARGFNVDKEWLLEAEKILKTNI